VTVGALVVITGARHFTGRVLIVTDMAMIVAVESGRSVTLRRDVASTNPDQWHYGGMPVTVSVRQTDFADRLADLEERTREEGR
jgi:hypothetical protein